MPFAYVLYIEDDIVGPCLSLIRNVCEPRSKARPHITVRYPVDKLHQNDLSEYEEVRVTSIDLVEPGSFGLDESSKGSKATIYIRCESDVLESLAYKPHFPDSVFHITCYDGRDIGFAKSLMSVLREFAWDMCVELPADTQLTAIPIGASKKRSSSPKARVYPERVQRIFNEITSEDITEDILTAFSPSQRLDLTRKICNYLHNATGNATKATNRKGTHVVGYSKGNPAFSASHVLNDENTSFVVQKSTAKRHGVFLTPPELARSIATHALRAFGAATPDLRFGDPAIGTGVFFAALAAIVPEEQMKSAIGIEIDPQRAIGTRNRWSHRGLQVEMGDYLHMERLPSRNIILANPPYVRYQNIPATTRELLRERASTQIGIEISGQASLYVYFLLLSHRWMEPNAIAAWLIPSEFMDTNYGCAVRHYLSHNVELIRVHRYDLNSVQFENALVSSAVVIFRNREPDPGATVEFSSGGSLEKPNVTCEVGLRELRGDSKWLIPRPSTVNDGSVYRFGDLFDIRRGIATGANDFFIMTRTRAMELELPDEALRPLMPKIRALNNDVVEREPDGYPSVDPQLCVLDCSVSEEVIKLRYPALWRYLETASNQVRNGCLVKRRVPWYRQEKRLPSPFLCTYMGRGSESVPALRFVWNKSEAIATNTYLMLYPKVSLQRELDLNEERYGEVFELLKGISIENLTNRGRVYGGGLYKIEPRELLSVPLNTYPDWLNGALNYRLAL